VPVWSGEGSWTAELSLLSAGRPGLRSWCERKQITSHVCQNKTSERNLCWLPPPLSLYAHQPKNRRQPGKGWKSLQVSIRCTSAWQQTMDRCYVNGSISNKENVLQLQNKLQTTVVQCNALHHKGHHVHLLHVLLPQHRDWWSGFSIQCFLNNSVILTRYRPTPWWWSVKIETCRSTFTYFNVF